MLHVREVNPAHIRHNPNLFQSSFWADFKEIRGYETQAFQIDCRRKSTAMFVIHRPCGNDGFFGYVPRGPDMPVPQDFQGPFLEEVSEKLRSSLPENCFFLRYDLPWRNPYVVESENGGSECLPPEPRVREMRMNFGSQRWNLFKAPTDMQHTATVILDISGSLWKILRGMHSKTRYSIRRAYKSGIKVVREGLKALPVWHSIYEDMARKKGITAEGLRYFHDLFTTHLPYRVDLRLYMAYHRGLPVAGNIIAFHGEYAYYLYSAASPVGRRIMASYATLWEAILMAKVRGCLKLDLMGIPPNRSPEHPMASLYRFKTRFGGEIVHSRGCWDYPFETEKYSSLAFASALENPFHPN